MSFVEAVGLYLELLFPPAELRLSFGLQHWYLLLARLVATLLYVSLRPSGSGAAASTVVSAMPSGSVTVTPCLIVRCGFVPKSTTLIAPPLLPPLIRVAVSLRLLGCPCVRLVSLAVSLVAVGMRPSHTASLVRQSPRYLPSLFLFVRS